MLDLETWGRRCGDIVRDPDDALRVVCTALDKPERHASIRQAVAEDLFFNPGCATESALRWLGGDPARHAQNSSPIVASQSG